ncbi:hypothetical protein [Nannocystis punicea]|uniref:Tryptophan synthase alpha chain n=1 Tax=Nannocystis punicea TaxID=2995304 RepID=A0ABY7H4F3_9BACT|nr:hypothetical protein [Nannocystis poenicansa]WAS94156.1 hypothetical protein O0S08_49165 [Nannocystis poenicansa]
MKLRLRLWSALFVVVACSPKADGESASDTQTSTETAGSTSGASDGSVSVGHSQTSANPSEPVTTTAGQTVTTASPTTFVTEGSATDGDPSDTLPGTVSTVTTEVISTSIGPDSFSTGFTTGGFCNDVPGQPQNAPCTDASGCGCESGKCFVVPAIGGFCGECLGDGDCPDGGCTAPNPVAGVGAVCNLGKAGDGCESDAACNDPTSQDCSPVLEVPGIITVATCGECKTDADCPAQAPHCTPDYDIGDFTGQMKCKAPDSVPNNGGCDFDGTGDQACASGFCGEASVMNLLKLGICGQCNSDADCPVGQQCTDPAVDLDLGALIGSVCM